MEAHCSLITGLKTSKAGAHAAVWHTTAPEMKLSHLNLRTYSKVPYSNQMVVEVGSGSRLCRNAWSFVRVTGPRGLG